MTSHDKALEERERAAFEAWARGRLYRLDRMESQPDEFYSRITRSSEAAWLARAAQDTNAARVAELEAEVARLREALEDTQTLLAAMLHEKRENSEIEEQMRANRAAISPAPCQEGEPSRCIACDLPLKKGDLYYPDDINGGELHAACCGPERECYTRNGEPLKDGDPIPKPLVWSDLKTPVARDG